MNQDHPMTAPESEHAEPGAHGKGRAAKGRKKVTDNAPPAPKRRTRSVAAAAGGQ